MESPNPVVVAASIVRALVSRRRPEFGTRPGPDHGILAGVLEAVAAGGIRGIDVDALDAYLGQMADQPIDEQDRSHALAFWLNVYNAGALRVAATADRAEVPSVLRLPGAFSRPFVSIGGEALSMDAIEHAKIRRFGDPRIHGALVCGSVSCPTLRPTPYVGEGLDDQLDDQMRAFLRGGGAVLDGDVVVLSRVFLWYGGDFVRPHRMPTFLPARRSSLLRALAPWLPPDAAAARSVEFQPYDWGLRCAIG